MNISLTYDASYMKWYRVNQTHYVSFLWILSHLMAKSLMQNFIVCKENRTMKFGRLIEYIMGNIFLQKAYIKWGRETRSRPLFWKKALCKIKVIDQHLSFNIVLVDLDFDIQQKETLKHSRDMFNFDFLEMGLGLASSSHFLYGFSRKIFLVLYSI